MTIITEQLLYCDAPPDECPWDGGCVNVDALKSVSRLRVREQNRENGGTSRTGKDYCPDCAKRLGLVKP